jgi:hypothetical protein
MNSIDVIVPVGLGSGVNGFVVGDWRPGTGVVVTSLHFGYVVV